MPKKLFEDDTDDLDIKTDNEYAKKYNTWRKKEELHKCISIDFSLVPPVQAILFQ